MCQVLVVRRARVVTIHNNPENVALPAKMARLQFQLADVDTQDASPFFAPTFDFIEEARAAGQGTSCTLPRCVNLRCKAVTKASHIGICRIPS